MKVKTAAQYTDVCKSLGNDVTDTETDMKREQCDSRRANCDPHRFCEET